jgi:hypothetical protein
MTAQIPDQFTYKNEEYSIVGINGPSLFNPEDYDLNPIMAHTACYRGYVASFNCRNNELVIESLLLNQQDKPPKINGIKPKKTSTSGLKYQYSDLNQKLNFTGKILIAKDFINEMYVHMGYQRPIAFETVIELQIDKGNITNVADFSPIIAKLREENPNKDASPDYDESTMEWIERLFSLNYDLPL